MKKEAKLVKKVEHLLKQIGCPRWLHQFGPKKYKFKQHALALLLKETFRFSFRRISNLLSMLGFEVPSYSALCKMRKRIPLWIWNSLLKLTAGNNHFEVAIDGTGYSLTSPSSYYVQRIDRKKPIKRFTKLSALYSIKRRKFIALKIRARPRHDVKDVKYLLKQNGSMKKLFGDSAYDAEWIHKECFHKGIQTIIKPRKNVKKGFFRKKQMKKYSEKKYHQRSLIESGFSSIKRRYGTSVLSKSLVTQRAEIYCRAIAHNISLTNQETFN